MYTPCRSSGTLTSDDVAPDAFTPSFFSTGSIAVKTFNKGASSFDNSTCVQEYPSPFASMPLSPTLKGTPLTEKLSYPGSTPGTGFSHINLVSRLEHPRS